MVIPIVMCNVAVLAEIFRAGINAVPKGQTEAAVAVGLTRGQAIREVVFPQAVRMIIPSLVTQLVSLLKDSTRGYAASFAELLRRANVLTARLHILIQVYIVISLIYIVIKLLLSYLSRVLERRLNRVRPAEGPTPYGRDAGEQEVPVMSMETAPGGSLMR